MNSSEYYDRVYGCWLGKNIGGTIGAPFEGDKNFHSVPAESPSRSLPNDDLDLQLVWLDVLKKKGVRITSDDLAEGWLEHIMYPFDEYGVAIANLKAGLKPPATGYYNNWFHGGMGAAIRSEIWACLFPGKPEIAGWYAYQDARVDHWGEGIYGEIFFAALESAAFESADLNSAIDDALSFLPESSDVFKVVKFVSGLHGQGKVLRECRDLILERFGHYNFTDCVQNIGFTVIGLLFGEGDFLKTIVSAVNCGYDADCTGATAGAVIGIMLGRNRIIEKGCRAGEDIVLGKIEGIEPPASLGELTRQVVSLKGLVAEDETFSSLPRPFSPPPVGEFKKPFSVTFEVSASYGLKEAEEVRGEILKNGRVRFEKTVFDSFHFDLDKYFGEPPSAVFLKTKMMLEEKRRLRLLPLSSGSVKMWLDGNLVLDNPGGRLFLPSPHRNKDLAAEVVLDRGGHDVLLEVGRADDGKLKFAWLPADEDNQLAVGIEYGGAVKGESTIISGIANF